MQREAAAAADEKAVSTLHTALTVMFYDLMGKYIHHILTYIQYSIWELLKSSALRKPLVVAVMMHLSQQLSGINCVRDSASRPLKRNAI